MTLEIIDETPAAHVQVEPVTEVVAESAVAELIGRTFMGEEVAAEESTEERKVEKFDFDETFQSHICRLTVRDPAFLTHTAHLLQPGFFESVGEAVLVNIVLKHHREYKCQPSHTAIVQSIKDAARAKTLKTDEMKAALEAYKTAIAGPINDREYFEDKVAEFARHQAVTQAIYDSVDLLKQKRFDKIALMVKKAIDIGVNREGEVYDYYERIAERTAERIDAAAGLKPPTGITTGNAKLDERLYHKGWGRKEMVTILGGAKAGKTTALINFAKSASVAGYHVLYLTLEVSEKIISERLDACLSDTEIKRLGSSIRDVESKINAIRARAGRLDIIQFPTGTLTCDKLRMVLDKAKSKGIKYDMIVVDYADIMAPNYRSNDPIENSKSIYVDLRAIAVEEDVAVLTATQTNREGFKATVARAEHTSEDFNKVRIVDLMISINATDEERANGEARLYFAASRNQEGGFTVHIKQNLAKMRFIESVLRVE